MRRIAIVLALLSVTASMAAEMPVSSPMFVPATDTLYDRREPVVVGGNGFLVLWEEGLFGPWPSSAQFRTYNSSGVPRMPAMVAVGGLNARAVWTGTHYLIVYAMEISRFGSPAPLPAVGAVLVQPDGKVVEESRGTLLTAQVAQAVVSLAWNGSEALALLGSGLLLRIDADARLIGDDAAPQGVTAVEAMGSGFLHWKGEASDRIQRGGGGYAVVRSGPGGVSAALLDASGTPGPFFAIDARGRRAASVAWAGGAWQTTYERPDGLCVASFTGPGEVTRRCRTGGETYPAIGASGDATLLVWVAGRQVVNSFNVVSEAAAPQSSPALAVDLTGLFTAWVEERGEGRRIHIGGVDGAGRDRDEVILEGNSDQSDPRFAVGAGANLLVWAEGGEIHAASIASNGEPIWPTIAIGYGRAPRVAALGDSWYVTWTTPANEVVGVLVTPNIRAEEPQRLGIPVPQSSPDVVAAGSGFLAVWVEAEQGAGGTHVRIAGDRVSRDGFAHGNRRVLAETFVEGTPGPDTAPFETPSIGCDSSRCLLTWYGQGEVFLRSLDLQGAPLGAAHGVRVDSRTERVPAVVLAEPRGGFRILHGGSMIRVSDAGVPTPAFRWLPVAAGSVDALWYGGRLLAGYSRATTASEALGQTGRVFLDDLVFTRRAVRR